MLLNTKIDKYSYEERIDNVDSFPYARELFSDGINSILHFILGYLTNVEPMIAPLFLGYQLYQYKPYDNTITDIEEYVIGYVAGTFFPLSGPFLRDNNDVPNFVKMKELGIF